MPYQQTDLFESLRSGGLGKFLLLWFTSPYKKPLYAVWSSHSKVARVNVYVCNIDDDNSFGGASFSFTTIRAIKIPSVQGSIIKFLPPFRRVVIWGKNARQSGKGFDEFCIKVKECRWKKGLEFVIIRCDKRDTFLKQINLPGKGSKSEAEHVEMWHSGRSSRGRILAVEC